MTDGETKATVEAADKASSSLREIASDLPDDSVFGEGLRDLAKRFDGIADKRRDSET